jgi:hypothetical protein
MQRVFLFSDCWSNGSLVCRMQEAVVNPRAERGKEAVPLWQIPGKKGGCFLDVLHSVQWVCSLYTSKDLNF